MRRLLLLLIVLASCSQKHPTRFEGCAMTIPYCIQLGDPVEEEQIQQIILDTFAEMNEIYNNWNPHSEVSQLRTLSAHQQVKLSDELAGFLAFVDTIVRQTEGRFDPTVEPLHLLWKENLREGHLPNSSAVTALQPSTGWSHLHLEGITFWKDDALTSLDLCGVAKGHAVDLLVERLAEAGYTSIYVEWGGEIRTQGQHPSGRPWRVAIYGSKNIDLSDVAIATSGSYLQNWIVDGESYTHIIDPQTGSPLKNSPITSVTVLAPTCAEADAYATALMLFPSIESAEVWATQRQIQAIIW